jgi:hypothetical protein
VSGTQRRRSRVIHSAVMAEPTAAPASSEDFEAAKVIYEKLKDLPRPRQERVLRWVAETLGIVNPAVASLPPAPPSPPAPPVGAPPSNTATPASAAPGATTDVRTFITHKNPQSDIEFVAAVAHFYRFDAPEAQRRETIDASFTREATRLADWDRLTNPKQTLNNAVNKGYLDRREPGQFAISTVGENLVARTLPRTGDAGARKATKRATNNKTKPTKKR